jgi:hypothetical protein
MLVILTSSTGDAMQHGRWRYLRAGAPANIQIRLPSQPGPKAIALEPGML